MKYIKRIVDKEIKEKLSISGAVVIKGPKWCGKTTSAKQVAKSVLEMQNPDLQENYIELANTRPSLLLEGEKPRLIDEWQIVPKLWNAVRYSVDNIGETNQYILTGSATPKEDDTMHSGVGRFSFITMKPMTLFESGDSNGKISLKDILDGKREIDGIRTDLDYEKIAHVLCRGGWPSSISIPEKQALQIAKNYIEVLCESDISKVDGVLFDLGVSSPQFDEDYRGFSYRYDAPLDMRMNQNSLLTAKYIVNEYSFEELLRVFKEYGEDKYSYNIAKNICKRREIKPIETTLELVEIIKASKPKKELDKVGHPAKQIFQALRIEVNDELNALEEALIGAIKRLKVNGRIVVITFQSLEDRIVKNIFRKYSVIEGNRLNDYINPKDIKTPDYQVINRKVITPSEEELKLNHRSKSAKLRILEKVK